MELIPEAGGGGACGKSGRRHSWLLKSRELLFFGLDAILVPAVVELLGCNWFKS